MRLRSAGVILALFVACAAWAQDDERVLLRYGWNAGDEIVGNVTAESTGMVITRDLTKDPVEEKQTPVWSRVLMPLKLVVEEVDQDGNASVIYEMGVMDMDIESEGEQKYVRIDPQAGTMTVDGEEQPLPEGTAAGMAGPFRVVVSPLGEVLEMDLPQGVEALAGATGMDMAHWMRMSQRWQATFPEHAIGLGHVWGNSMKPAQSVGEETEGTVDEEQLPGEASLLFRLADVRLVEGVQTAQIEMLGAMDFENLPVGGPGMMGAAAGSEDLQMTMGPMHLSMVGTMSFDVEAGMVTGNKTTVITDIVQRLEGTVATPEGEQREVNMEIITRGLTTDSTVEFTK